MQSIFAAMWAVSATVLAADAGQMGAFHEKKAIHTPGKFTFVRVEYESVGGYGEAYYDYDGRFWHRWQTDYPEAEENLLYRLGELTTIDTVPEPISLKLTNPSIFNFPLIYMCDVGWQTLSREETKALREYLERGGFLWIDDFWGDMEWQNLWINMKEAFPEHEWVDIPKDHAILNMVFPLEECPQVPAKIFWETSGWPESYDPPGPHRQPAGGIAGVKDVNFRGLFDEDGRLMAVATHNTDLGDGWEREGEDVSYFEKYSVKSYAMSVNIITYALTH